jgi:hypothetical protein
MEEEFKRRDVLLDQHGMDQPDDVEPGDVGFHIHGQNYALVTMGTAVHPPRPVDADNPFLRVYGAFHTKQDAVEHAQSVMRLDPDSMICIAKCREWLLLPNQERTPEECDARRDELLAVHAEARQAEQERFEERVRNKQCCEVKDVELDPPPPDPEEEEAEGEVYTKLKKLPTGGDVRNQRFVALSILPEASGECMVQVLGCFDTADEATKWVRGVATKEISDFDIVVHDTCEWMRPNSIRWQQSTSRKSYYRNGEMQRMADYQLEQRRSVKTFKEWESESNRGLAMEASMEPVPPPPCTSPGEPSS